LGLLPGKAQIAAQRLITVGTVEFEFVGVHVHPVMRKWSAESMGKNFCILSGAASRM
jgi:hypothetical protein